MLSSAVVANINIYLGSSVTGTVDGLIIGKLSDQQSHQVKEMPSSPHEKIANT